MAAAGLDVHAYDQRGQRRIGRPPRPCRSLVAVPRRPRGTLPRRPRRGAARQVGPLYGHSMGGLVVLGYLLTERSETRPRRPLVARARFDARDVEEGAGARDRPRRCRRWSVPNGIDGSTLSRDPSVVCARSPPTRCAGKASTARLRGRGARGAAPRQARASPGLTIPTLVLHGLDDGLVPAEASELLADATERRAADLPGAPARAPQRARGPRSSTRSSPGSESRATIGHN